MRKKGTWKQKRKRRLKQGLGFVLSAAMVMSLSGGSILTAFAAEDDSDTGLSDEYEVELEQSEDGYYLIYDENDVLSYAEMIENGYADSSARLADDITVSADTGFAGFGTYDTPYAGTFDGDGHTVTLSMSTDSAAGLFAFVDGATIESVTTAGTVTTTVSTYGCAGLVSYVMGYGVTVKDCVNKADVSGTSYVGGLIGRPEKILATSKMVLTVEDSANEGSITGTNLYVGGILSITPGTNYSKASYITDCINYGTVSGYSIVGGVVGGGYGATISRCGNEGAVSGTSYVGGIVGSGSTDSLVMDSVYNIGAVSGGSLYVGGIIGSTTSYVSLSNAYNLGTITGPTSSTGAILGSNQASSTSSGPKQSLLSNIYNAGEVIYTATGTYAPGLLVGSIKVNGSVLVDNVYYLSSLSGSAVASGTLYSNSTQKSVSDDELAAMAKTSSELQDLASTLGDSFADNFVDTYHSGYPILSWEDNGDDLDAAHYGVTFTLANISGTGRSKATEGTDYTATLTTDQSYYALPESITITVGGTEISSGEGYAYDAENGSLTIYASYITGEIEITAAGVPKFTVLEQDEEGFYLIASEEDILTFAIMVEADYEACNAKLTSDITITADTGFAGFGTSSAPFSDIFDGDGHTVTLSMSTDGAAGLFAYVSGGTIENVTTAGTVESSVNTYGCASLVSYVMADGVTVKNCVNKANVSGTGYVAGLIGRCSDTSVSVTVADSSNEGSITSASSYAGGIAAYIYNGSVTGCVNYGAVSGTTYKGGIAGRADSYGSLEISDCGNEGTITGSSSYTGGVVGYTRGSSSEPLILDGLYNAGTVTGTTYVGGIVGMTYAGMSNVYNTGAVSGTDVSTGGIVGDNYLSGTVLSNAYNAGEVTYTSSDVIYAGGLLVGRIMSSSYVMYVENAYYLSTLDGSAIAFGSDYLYSNSTQAALTDDELAAMAKTFQELQGLAGTLGNAFQDNWLETYHGGYPILSWEDNGDDPEAVRYDVSFNLTNISSDDGRIKAVAGSDYTATMTPDEYYVLPESITVTVAGSELVSGEGYAYDATVGSLTIYASYITGDIVITMAGIAPYEVSTMLTNINSNAAPKASVGLDYTATMTPDEYYALPESITVTVAGSELVSGEGYAYDATVGSLTIYASYITGDIVITASAEATSYSVGTALTNLSSDVEARVAVGSDYTVTLSVENQYFKLPESISVTVGGTELISGEGYAYDAESGSLTIYAAYITGDIVITAEGVLVIDLTPDEEGCYLLYTEDDIMDFAGLVAYSSADIDARLMADITVSADSGFTGIGTLSAPYAGTFDGNGYTVTLSMSTTGAAGLFAYVSGATIENVTTAGTVETTKNTYGCAGLISYAMADGVTVKNCVNKANVSGIDYVAGLIGKCSANSVSVTVADSSNEGSITSTGGCAGGIAAYIYNGSVTGCMNYGSVSGTTGIGGIAGYAYSYGSLEISDCGNEGVVTGSSNTGGVVGYARCLSSASLILDGLYNAGTVTGTTYVGGIVGWTYAGMSNVYNTGAVSGTAVSTGGIVGYNYLSGAVLSNAYNAGEVTYTSSDVTYAGGLLVGNIANSRYVMYVGNAYYLSTLDGSVVASGSSYFYSNSTKAALTDDEIAAMAKTSDELAALADTLGESFVTNTNEDYHQGYPILTWEDNTTSGGEEEKESLNGLYADEDGTLAYYVDGVIDTGFTGVTADEDGTTYYVENGYVGSYTGLAKDASDGTWYYFTDSVLDAEYTGLVKNAANGILYYVSGGTIGWSYTGPAKYAANGCWYYVSGGTIDWTYTGLAKNTANGIWYYFADGALDWSYTGMVKHSSGVWYYVSGGQLDWSFTGDVTTESGTYHFENGTIVWDYTAA